MGKADPELAGIELKGFKPKPELPGAGKRKHGRRLRISFSEKLNGMYLARIENLSRYIKHTGRPRTCSGPADSIGTFRKFTAGSGSQKKTKEADVPSAKETLHGNFIGKNGLRKQKKQDLRV